MQRLHRPFLVVLCFLTLAWSVQTSAENVWKSTVEQALYEHRTNHNNEKAIELCQNALKYIEEHGEPYPGSRAYTKIVVTEIYTKQSQVKLAEPYIASAYDELARIEKSGEKLPLSKQLVCAQYGEVLRMSGKKESAEMLLEGCLKERKPGYSTEIHILFSVLWSTLQEQEKYEESGKLADQAIQAVNMKGEQLDAQTQVYLAALINMKAKSLEFHRSIEKIDDVLQLMEKSVGICDKTVHADDRSPAQSASDPPLICALVYMDYAELLNGFGKADAALPYAASAYETRRFQFGESHPLTIIAMLILAETKMRQRHYEDALTLMRQLSVKIKPYSTSNPPMVKRVQDDYLQVLHALGKNDEADKIQRDNGLWIIH